jgi:hypothetical protein
MTGILVTTCYVMDVVFYLWYCCVMFHSLSLKSHSPDKVFTNSKQHQLPTTNNKHMINQQVSLENSYWQKKIAGASSNSHRKMQKLARDKQEISKTRR